jgi:hypothetical protein
MATQRESVRSGEFFAPLPLAALALLVVNDVWLKPTFHSAVTGKLSDVAICFLMPLFFSELLGLLLGVAPRTRLRIGAFLTAALFTALEVVPPCTALALHALAIVGPRLGIHGTFRMTSDWTDLFCLVMIVPAVAYGRYRLRIDDKLRRQ